MCANWKINGHFCENGADLVAAIGIDMARNINTQYGMIGKEGFWRSGENGERIPVQATEETIASQCLCWVDADLVKAETGIEYRYDCEEDAYVPLAKTTPSTKAS